MKPLSKNRIKELEFWVSIIALTMMIIIIVCHTIITNEVNFDSASPCELGLMEWEETKGHYCFGHQSCAYDKWGELNCIQIFYEEEINPDEFISCWNATQKSCPYSGPGIMVVQND